MRILLTGNTCFKIANFREGLIRTLLARGWQITVLAPTDPYRDRLTGLGCTVIDLPMDRNGTAPHREAALLARILAVLRRERPDIVLGFTIKNNIYAGLACRWMGIPFVPNVTGLGPAFNGRGLLNLTVRTLYRFAFAKARGVLFQNPDDRATFVSAGIVPETRTQLVPGSGVDLRHFTAKPAPDEGDPVTFLLVSRLLWDKGVGLFVEAARELRGERPDLRFQVLGPIDSASRSAVPKEQLQTWVREGVIDYLGETMDVRPFLAAADCIVLPSWYREGTPRVLLEAAATARPVITTDMPGCRDAVDDRRTGFICAPRSADALRAAMTQFASLDRNARIAMGKAARSHAEAHFDEARVIEAYLSLIQVPARARG